MIEERNKSFNEDFKKYDTFIENCRYLKNLEHRYTDIHESIQNEIKPHLKLLEKNEFIKKGDEFGEYELTEMGKMASNINEIHSLAISDLLHNEHIFSNLNVVELVSVLSIFCDIRLSDDNKIFSIESTNVNENIRKNIKMIKKVIDCYYDKETFYETNFTFNYTIQYDLVEMVYKWANCNDEVQCQLIIKEMEQWDIYIGNFTKAILKICNIAMELENVI